MCQRGCDLAGVQVFGAGLDAVVVSLKPFVVLRRDPVAEDVDRLGLSLEVDGQLLGDEHVGKVRKGKHPVDRVVVGDRDEVHAPALGELVDLAGLGGALGQCQGALNPQLRQLRRRRVHVHIDPARVRIIAVLFVHGHRIALENTVLVKFTILSCEVPVKWRKV